MGPDDAIVPGTAKLAFSVWTAISLAISTLVSLIIAAVRGANASVPAITPEPPALKPEPPATKPEPDGVKELIKKYLVKIGERVKNAWSRGVGIASGRHRDHRELVAQNGGEAVGWVAEHLWALVVGVGA